MDLTPFKLDLDELLADFVEGKCITLADMKRKWKEKKVSYIFETKHTRNTAFFMQSLYTHCFSHMILAGPLPRRLGALYILYCLHEVQPYEPPIKIYLSLGELRMLRNLIEEAKGSKVELVPALVKRMLEKNMFLFGFVDVLSETARMSVHDIVGQPKLRVEDVHDRLLADNNIEKYLHMNLGAEMEVDKLKKALSEYELAKELAIQEASKTTDVRNVEHIIEKKTAGDVMESIVQKWDAQKDDFYEKTEFKQPGQVVAAEDIFDKELDYIFGEE